jgi:hypothetical protein
MFDVCMCVDGLYRNKEDEDDQQQACSGNWEKKREGDEVSHPNLKPNATISKWSARKRFEDPLPCSATSTTSSSSTGVSEVA